MDEFKMKAENLAIVIEICTKHHSTKMSINCMPHDSKSVSRAIPVVIHECCPSVINKLREAGFALSMKPEGLHVADYSV